MPYSGPIIDPHVHFWAWPGGAPPWLRPENSSVAALGDLAALRGERLPRHYARDAAGENVVATVHVEAGQDPADALAETGWVAGLGRAAGAAQRCVAFVALEAADAEAQLDAHRTAARGILAGVRARLSWDADPAKRFASRPDIMRDPAWRRGAALLASRGLHLEVMIYPHQADDLAHLAADLPRLTIVVNHCASPVDRDPEGIARWRRALCVLAAHPNVAIKISNVGAYVRPVRAADVEDVVRACVDAFGADRCMFASDWPVVTLHTPLAVMFAQFRAAADRYAAAQQAALFHGTAARLYGIGSVPPGNVSASA